MQGNRHVSTWIFVACGAWLFGLGIYFMVLRPPLLPEDSRFIGMALADIRNAVPGLEGWLQKVFLVTGGFMAGTGVLTMFVACVALPSRSKETAGALALCGALSVAAMSLTNFVLNSGFKWLLAVPALVWLSGLVLLVARRD